MRFLPVLLAIPSLAATGECDLSVDVPGSIRTVLENTEPLQHSRGDRLPLFVLPITGALAGCDDVQAAALLQELDKRGIGYTVDWSPGQFEKSAAEGLRIARMQQALGQPVSVNANACLHSFCDGSLETLHVDKDGETFSETSFGPSIGCPFSLDHRIPVIKERVEQFLRAYRDAEIAIDFIFADWEIDGPIEWNDAWDGCKRCTRCRDRIANIDDFRVFQKTLRDVRSKLQRIAFAENVRSYFPAALVGNYGVNPHGGLRYWYDYFERETSGAPVVWDQRAPYREWAHEFEATGYTFAMPVVYTWYPIFGWYDFADLDYRWFYNMLLVGSNAGQSTPANTPIITFVHWTTTAPPNNPDPTVRQLSAGRYRELLWHLLLRGHDGLFLWCQQHELADEVRLLHDVYSESMAHHDFLRHGVPVSFDVPKQPGTVVSGLRIGNRVLARRTDFGEESSKPVQISLGDGNLWVRESGTQLVNVQQPK
jgi:hypothetical protein